MSFLKSLNKSANKSLIIFPHAGAIPGQYAKWAKQLEQNFNIYIFNKKTESISIEEAASEALRHYNPTEETVVFAHSFGCYLAYELSKKIKDIKLKLVFSSMKAPSLHIASDYESICSLNDEEFEKLITTLGAFTEELKKDQEFKKLLLNRIKKDFKLLSKYQPAIEKVPHDFHCWYATKDPLANIENMSSWKELCLGRFSFKAFQGDHFYHLNKKQLCTTSLLSI